MRFVQRYRLTKMWLLILIIGVCSPHWTIGLELRRGAYLVFVRDNILKTVRPIPSPLESLQTIDLRGLGIRKLKYGAFDNSPNAVNLNLANNDLDKLQPLIFSKLRTLETLSLANNKISILNRAFVGLSSLKSLNLSNNSISSLKKTDLLGLPKSVDIIMEGNKLQTLTIDPHEDPSQPRFMASKRNNIYVDPWSDLQVYDGQLKALRTSTFKRTAYWSSLDLQTLNLTNRKITEITSEMFNELPKLIIIGDLQKNNIETIQKDAIQNKFLWKLNLDHNAITTIEYNAFRETRLLSISVNYNRLKDLDFARTLPITIRELALGGNNISTISGDSLVNLKRLRHLMMPFNRIVHLSVDAFRGLQNLRLIDLSNNLLETIEPATFRDQKELLILRLSNNKIKMLQHGIFESLGKLQTLELYDNAIRKISRSSFTGLKKSLLHKLMLSRNEIDTIEEGSFANMTIEMLLLDGNQISEKSIAKGAFESCTLSWLSLQSNSFTWISGDSFYGILVYTGIRLRGNNIRIINRGAAKYMGGVRSLHLTGNPVERIENGSFYGFRRGPFARIILNRDVKVIEGGVFEDV